MKNKRIPSFFRQEWMERPYLDVVEVFDEAEGVKRNEYEGHDDVFQRDERSGHLWFFCNDFHDDFDLKTQEVCKCFFEEASTYHENDVSCEDSDHK